MPPGPEPVTSLHDADWLVMKDAVKRFEHAWREHTRPGIEDYLHVRAPLRFRVLIELVHVDLELRLKAGESALAEEYLGRYPELTGDRAATLELIATEYDLRRRREPGLALDEYVQRFPEFRDDLAGQISRSTICFKDAPRPNPGPRAETPPAVAGYEILGRLGGGGMGVVYKARQASLDRLVALKFLPEECARDAIWLARFRREARTASGLNHPHICTIHDTGEAGGRPFLSMELIEGQTFEALVDRRPAVDDLARWAGQAARALAAAHAAGVVHRDVKPANLMLRDDGIVKVLDFGLARRVPVSGATGPATGDPDTDPGIRVGTLLYMSPEQARAEPVHAASDIFSLGLVLYELATGQHPFRLDTEVGILNAIVSQPPVPPARLNPEIPAPLDALIQHMLAKDFRLRPGAVAVAEALTRLTPEVSGGRKDHPARGGNRPRVGRQDELAALLAAFEGAVGGCGSVVCVTGEPGLGKTTLVETFFEEVTAGGRDWGLARGRCSERLAGAEAYLPFLEALDDLLRGAGGAAAAQAMKLLAPTWYVQLQPLAAAADPALSRVFSEARDASQERRKRELCAFLTEISRQRPLVVFLDDLHWADPSSVDLLAYIGGRCSGWRVLVVLTYRPSDLIRSQHAFGPVKLELQGRGVCREVALPFLSRADLDHYLALDFVGHAFPDDLAAVLHARTEGNPLFMVDLLRYLRDRGVVVQTRGGWELTRAVPDLQRMLPESVRGMVQRKLDQLGAADLHLLMAASVRGPEFDSAVVARMLGRDAADVEERLAVLGRVHALVRFVREQTFPDGVLTARYGFVHVLYQNALYAALQPTRKAAWSAAAARALSEHFGENSTGLAAELGLLFEAAGENERAADSYLVAAENAGRGFAHHEAVGLARRGLVVLQRLPETTDRARRELSLQVTLGNQLQVTQGFAAAEVERIYVRACELYEQVPEAPSLFPVLWGLWMFYEVRGRLEKSRELAVRLFSLARRDQDPAHLLQARQALAVTSLCLGDPTATREHVEQGLALYNPTRYVGNAYVYGLDPGVGCLAFGSVALWLLGYPDQAVQRSRAAAALGTESGHPSSFALALHFAAVLRQYRREGAAVRESAEAIVAVATDHGFPFWLAGGQIMRGWAQAESGMLEGGIAELRRGVAAWTATGGETYQTYFLALLAEALGRDGRFEEGMSVLEKSMSLMGDTGESFHGAELHRLRGEFLLRGHAEEAEFEADACFRRALAIARRQRAKSLELRAAMSLTRLYQKLGQQGFAYPILAECYGWFTEGFDTQDLRDARALLTGRPD